MIFICRKEKIKSPRRRKGEFSGAYVRVRQKQDWNVVDSFVGSEYFHAFDFFVLSQLDPLDCHLFGSSLSVLVVLSRVDEQVVPASDGTSITDSLKRNLALDLS